MFGFTRAAAGCGHCGARVQFFTTGCNERPVRQIRERCARPSRARSPRARSPRDFDPRRARAQSQGHRSRHSARSAGGVHRAVRLGQILARLRHHLCRRPAPLCREPVGLCAAIPGNDAKAGRRPDRRPVAGNFDRAENHLAQSALDGRHGDRNLRLHAASVGAGRRALFAGHGSADREPDHLADGRSHPGATQGVLVSTSWRQWCAAGRASTARNSPSL